MARRDLAHLMSIHRRLARSGHDLPVRAWDGTELGPADRGYRLVLNRPSALREMLVPPTDLQVGEAYLADAFEIEGSMVEAIRAVARLREGLTAWDMTALSAHVLQLPGSRIDADGQRVRLRGRRHSKARDRAAVRHHYDVDVDFYRLFLDEELVYSCAYFLEDDEDLSAPPDPMGSALETAQARKLEVICRKLGLQPGMRLLDIGCGWGSLVLHAARHHGVGAVGITLSPRQAEVADKRIAEADLGDRVEVRVEDYRDVTGQFDAVASVGMVEHVGTDRLATYFARAHELTAPGGRFLNHGITTGRRREPRDLSRGRGAGFVGRYVFPDGALVPASTAVTHMEDAGFELLDVEQLRPNYARTLQHWTARLEHRRGEAVAVAGEETFRIWRAYMAGSVVGFESGDLGIVQTLGQRGGTPPVGRPWGAPVTSPPQ